MNSECFPSEFFFFDDSVYETLPLVQLPGKVVNHRLLGSHYCLYTYNIKGTYDRCLKLRPFPTKINTHVQCFPNTYFTLM